MAGNQMSARVHHARGAAGKLVARRCVYKRRASTASYRNIKLSNALIKLMSSVTVAPICRMPTVPRADSVVPAAPTEGARVEREMAGHNHCRTFARGVRR